MAFIEETIELADTIENPHVRLKFLQERKELLEQLEDLRNNVSLSRLNEDGSKEQLDGSRERFETLLEKLNSNPLLRKSQLSKEDRISILDNKIAETEDDIYVYDLFEAASELPTVQEQLGFLIRRMHRDNYQEKYQPEVFHASVENIISGRRRLSVHERIKEKIQNLKEMKTKPIKSSVKLQWKGSPAQFGYLMLELAQQGYIEIPSTSGEASYRKYATICYKLFELDTTEANLIKEMNPNTNSLVDSNRAKFQIPDLAD